LLYFRLQLGGLKQQGPCKLKVPPGSAAYGLKYGLRVCYFSLSLLFCLTSIHCKRSSCLFVSGASWFKTFDGREGAAGQEVAIYPRQLQISHVEDARVQNYNFTHKFSQNGGLPAPDFVFSEERIPKKPAKLKLRGYCPSPPCAMTPQYSFISAALNLATFVIILRAVATDSIFFVGVFFTVSTTTHINRCIYLDEILRKPVS